MSNNKYIHDNIICSCHNTEHIIIITKNENKNIDNNAYLSIHLIPEHNIFKRIKNAIKYIFGYRCKYGYFDSITLNKEHYEQINNLANFLKP